MVYFKIRFYQSWRRQWPYKNYETLYINHNINHCKGIYFFGFLNLTLMQDVCLLTIIMLAQHPCTLKWWDYDTIGVPVTYCSNKMEIRKKNCRLRIHHKTVKHQLPVLSSCIFRYMSHTSWSYKNMFYRIIYRVRYYFMDIL